MTSEVVYIPALKAKRGEFRAVRSLSITARRQILPLFDVLPVPMNWNTGRPSKTLEAHLDNICKHVADCWGHEREVLVDLFDLDLGERTTSGRHPLEHLFGAFQASNVLAIPVTGLDRDSAYEAATAGAVTFTDGAVGIRLLPEDMALPTKLSARLLQTTAALNADSAKSFLLLDCRGLPEDRVGQITQDVIAALRSARRTCDWRRCALLASGMPDGMSSIKANTQARVRRTELALWKNVMAGYPESAPLFGDYGVIHPEFMEPRDPKSLNPSAKIRYTLDDEWLIIKGRSYKKDPQQFRSMAASLADREEYRGPDFSWGDGHIFKCRTPSKKVGNLETWVQVGTSHHIELVSRQISNLLAV